MISHRSKQSALYTVIVAALAFLVTWPARLSAQDTGGSMAQSGQQAATALTGDQQLAANSALCSAIGSQVPNPAAASPSLLSSPSVISAAAPIFAGSTQLPLPNATSMLQGYVAQHATDILASCAVGNATGGLPTKIQGMSSMPSLAKML
ncbi:MAG: hypothetical protein ACLPZJ_21705 [Terriglobales bacterium]